MGDVNQKLCLQHFVKNVEGAILEIGSKDYGNTQNFRELFPNNEYIGVDLSEGKGLEHTPVPWIMAQNMDSLLRGGTLYISVPWVWRYHPYPDDYFRFSARGIMSLFPHYQWTSYHWSTYVTGEFFSLDFSKNDSDSKLSLMANTQNGQRKYLPYLMVNMVGSKK